MLRPKGMMWLGRLFTGGFLPGGTSLSVKIAMNFSPYLNLIIANTTQVYLSSTMGQTKGIIPVVNNLC